MRSKLKLITLLVLGACFTAAAQDRLYDNEFPIGDVKLLDGPFKHARDLNLEVLLQYDVDRLLTPYVRQSGLASTTNTASPYYRWESKQVLDLLEDLAKYAREEYDNLYCLQPLVVKHRTWEKDGQTVEGWEVIDGQQRLTTLWFILNQLKNDDYRYSEKGGKNG